MNQIKLLCFILFKHYFLSKSDKTNYILFLYFTIESLAKSKKICSKDGKLKEYINIPLFSLLKYII